MVFIQILNINQNNKIEDMNLIKINFKNFFKSLKDRTTEMVTLKISQIIKTHMILTKLIVNKKYYKYNNNNMINRNKQLKEYYFKKIAQNVF